MEQKQLIKQLTARFQCPVEQRYAFLEKDAKIKAIGATRGVENGPTALIITP